MSEVNTRRGPGSGDRGPDPTLADYERDLQSALSIEPSPAFEARVRQRVDADRGSVARVMWFPAVVGRGLKTPALLAASLLLVTTAIVLLQRTTPDVQAPQVAERRPDVVLPPQPAPPAAAPRRESPVAVARAPRQAVRRSEPEVIVVNQMEAVRRLVAAVADGRLAVPAAPEGPVEAPKEMVIAPLVVEPMPVPTVEGDPIPPVPDIRKTK